MKSTKLYICLILVSMLGWKASAQTRKDTVWEIIRSHDYMLAAGLVDRDAYFPAPEGFSAYKKAGLNTSFSWSSGEKLIDSSARYGIQWIGRGGNLSALRSQYDRFPGGVGANYVDEPSYKLFPNIANFHRLARRIVPEVVHFTTLLPSYSTYSPKIEGNNWRKHIDDYIRITDPDALIWNFYPYGSGWCAINVGYLFQPRFNDKIYSDMAYIRQKGLAANIPYGGWLSAFGRTCPSNGEDFGFRYPSESDFRYHAFLQLAYGSHIMLYFNYATTSSAEGYPTSGFIEQNGSKKPIYAWSKILSPWIRNIGNETNLMRSAGVSWIRGRQGSPSGLSDWQVDAHGNTDIAKIEIYSPQEDENGLVGFFDGADNTGGKALLLVNTNQAGDRNADGRSAKFFITVKPGKKLWKMDKSTGEVKECALVNNLYQVLLPRGTGEFFYTELPDYDQDGIPNWYERYHKLDHMSAANAHQDPDGDCYTNLQEYQNNTNPKVPNAGGVCDNRNIEVSPQGTYTLGMPRRFYTREYYPHPSLTGKYSISVECYPIGGNTKDVKIGVEVAKTPSAHESVNSRGKEGMFIGARRYKIKLLSGNVNGPIRARLYYTLADSTDLDGKAKSFMMQSGARYLSPQMWLQLGTRYSNTNVHPLGINGFSGPARIISQGKESGVPYVEVELDFRGGKTQYSVVASRRVTDTRRTYSPPPGTMRYNSAMNKFQGWNGSRWINFN